jgi:cytochrome c553
MRTAALILLAGCATSLAAGEFDEALKLKPDLERGRVAYEVCQGCHRPDGAGRPDGSYPQLAGQHAAVLLKQMADIRAGQRDNPKMHPFITGRVVTVQEMADIAAFLRSLKPAPDNGRGPGTNLERGARLYDKNCRDCHGPRGEGDEAEPSPALAGQHFPYLVRQIREIRDGTRRNANRTMRLEVRGYSDEDVEAVADYLSRLRMETIIK